MLLIGIIGLGIPFIFLPNLPSLTEGAWTALIESDLRVLARHLNFEMLAVLAAFAAVYLLGIRKHGIKWSDFGFEKCSWKWIAGSAALAVPLTALALLSVFAMSYLTDVEHPKSSLGILADRNQLNLISFVFFTLIAVLLGPIYEELLLRGVIFTWLRSRWRFVPAALITALLFGLLHGFPQAIFPYLIIDGFIYALLYEKSRSLWTAIIAHGMGNFLPVLAGHAWVFWAGLNQ